MDSTRRGSAKGSALKRFARALAWAAVVGSFPLWGSAFVVVPWLPLSAGARVGVGASVLALSEVLFWVGGLYLGASVLARLRPPKVTTGRSCLGLRVVVIGASGGLGSAIARAVKREGGRPVLVGRSAEQLGPLATELNAEVFTLTLSETALAEPEGVAELAAAIAAAGPLSHVVCAVGADVRKPFLSHSTADLARLLTLNLWAPLGLSRAFIPVLADSGTLTFLGGFGSGRLPLPYHVPDVASRAGLAAFCDALNNELCLEGKSVRACYVSPAPADTLAERPYAALWTELGTPPIAPERVANVVLRTLLSRSPSVVMGWSTRLVTTLHAILPGVGGWALRRTTGNALQAHLGAEAAAARSLVAGTPAASSGE